MSGKDITALLSNNEYAGRGIILGLDKAGKNAVIAYFLMGRSVNSRNRVFVENGNGLLIRAFDESKMEDPSLIIYSPILVSANNTIVTNGDQTDTVYEALQNGGCFEDALRKRTYEPDAPNYTSRISGMVTVAEAACTYKLSILKRLDTDNPACLRQFFDYEAVAGTGHFIHTYLGNDEPLPRFCGEPVRLELPFADIDEFTAALWRSLNADNKVSLVTRYISLADGEYSQRIINRNC